MALGQVCGQAIIEAEGRKVEMSLNYVQDMRQFIPEVASALGAGDHGWPTLRGRLPRMSMLSNSILATIREARNQFAAVEASASKLQQGGAAGHEMVQKALVDVSERLRGILAWFDNIVSLSQTLHGRTEDIARRFRDGLTEESARKCSGLTLEVSAVAGVITAAYDAQRDAWLQGFNSASWELMTLARLVEDGDKAELQQALQNFNDGNSWMTSRGASKSRDEAVKHLDKTEKVLSRYE